MAPTIIINHQLPSHTHNTYDVFFYDDSIRTTVTHDPTTVSWWISESEYMHPYWFQQVIVGLDIEWRPCFVRNMTRNRVATLQLCVGNRCLIYQIIHSPGIPPSLTRFLSNPNHTFVGVGIKADLEKLQEDYGLGFNTNSVDLKEAAVNASGRSELRNSGLKDLARIVLQKEMEKPRNVTMSRWDDRGLTPDQVQYACIDAFVCSEIGRALL